MPRHGKPQPHFPIRVLDNNGWLVAGFASLETAHRWALGRLDGGTPDVLTIERFDGDFGDPGGDWFPIRRISRLPFEHETTITELAGTS